MYKMKVKDSIFTIPKENVRFLAMTKAIDRQDDVSLKTEQEAVSYLESLGIEFLESEEV